MKYVMFVCADEGVVLSPEDEATIGPGTQAWVDEMEQRGVRLLGQRLSSISDATVVRVREGELLVADGPFAETKEQIAGFDILDCADLDEAIEIAAKDLMARFGTLEEVRPFWSGRAGRMSKPRSTRRSAPSGRLVATLIRVTGDWNLAEDCAQDCFHQCGPTQLAGR